MKRTKEQQENYDNLLKAAKKIHDLGFNVHSTIKNKYNLTEDEQVQMLNMTPKEKKEFLKAKR